MRTSRSFHQIYTKGKRSSALVMTMFLVSLLAIMLVGFVASMRTETTSARSHLGGVRSNLYAQAGIDAAMARLSYQLASTTSSGKFWATRPGQLISTTIPASGNPTINWVDLSSGLVGAATPDPDLNVDLNIKSVEDSSRNLIFSTNVVARVQWLYIRKDGTHFTTATKPTYNAANPIVGRYAFWVDDESAKININTAATRLGNSKELGHPSRVDMSGISPLTTIDAAAISNYRATAHYFDSLNDAASVSTISTAMKTCSYALTPYNHSPELNMFNEPRIMLTTKQSVAGVGNANFLDVLVNSAADPGAFSNLDGTKLNAAISKIYAYFTRSDWPMQPGSKFTDKYTEDTKQIQTIINIIDYVRSAESTMTIADPIRGSWDSATKKFTLDSTAAGTSTVKAMLGNTRHFCVVEIGTFMAPAANYTLPTNVKYLAKIYLPKQIGGTTPVNLRDYSIIVQVAIGGTQSTGNMAIGAASASSISGVIEVNNNYIMNPGDYRLLNIAGTQLTNSSTTRPATIPLRIGIGSATGRPELVPIMGSSNWINCPIDDVTVVNAFPIPAIKSMQLVSGDPIANKLAENWTSGANSFALSPDLDSIALPAPTSGLLSQQDTTSGGNLSAASIRHPAPASGTRVGVQSVGELGYIHTGMECWQSAAGVNTSVAFRTLRLQPMKTGSTVLPDWALFDLFCAPPPVIAPADKPYIQPSIGTYSGGIAQNTGGLVNVNSRVTSFVDGSGADTIKRMQPLMALCIGATNSVIPSTTTVSYTLSSTIAANIYNRTLASGNSLAIGKNYGVGVAANLYFSPAQIVEMQSVADGGETSEELVHNILSLATTRGNVFTIYSVGQSIQQTTSGNIDVNGERRYQTMVERRVSGGKVSFQIVFNRDLRP